MPPVGVGISSGIGEVTDDGAPAVALLPSLTVRWERIRGVIKWRPSPSSERDDDDVVVHVILMIGDIIFC